MKRNKDKRIVIPQDARILIFSDLHLPQRATAESAGRLNLLSEMLASEATNATHVVLLGDVFDFWFEYPHLVPNSHHRLLWDLRTLVVAGKKVIFFPGNHDYWIGDFYERELGMRVARNLETWSMGDQTIVLTHGDGCDPHDRGYHLLKRILRARLAIKAFSLVHPEVAFAIARVVSALSRKASEKKKTWHNSRFMPFASRMFTRGVDAVIVGHSHTPQIVDTGSGLLINSGDWLKHMTYCMVTEKVIELRAWPSRECLPIQGVADFENPPLSEGSC